MTGKEQPVITDMNKIPSQKVGKRRKSLMNHRTVPIRVQVRTRTKRIEFGHVKN